MSFILSQTSEKAMIHHGWILLGLYPLLNDILNVLDIFWNFLSIFNVLEQVQSTTFGKISIKALKKQII